MWKGPINNLDLSSAPSCSSFKIIIFIYIMIIAGCALPTPLEKKDINFEGRWKGMWTSQWNEVNPHRPPRALSEGGKVVIEINKNEKYLSGWVEFSGHTLVPSERIMTHGEIKTGDPDFMTGHCNGAEKIGIIGSYSNGATIIIWGCLDSNIIKGGWNITFKNHSFLPDGGRISLNRI